MQEQGCLRLRVQERVKNKMQGYQAFIQYDYNLFKYTVISGRC